MSKAEFVLSESLQLLKQINVDAKPLFGKMNAQQMIEHLVYSVDVASGKTPVPEVLSGDMQTKAKAFMLSDKGFKENTPNQLLPNEPIPFTYQNMDEAIAALSRSLLEFEDAFRDAPNKTIQNAFFGRLNYTEQVHLLHKHFWHHLQQFGIQPQHS